MAGQRRRVIWTRYASEMLDEAVAHLNRASPPAAERLLSEALDAASSLDAHTERGRVVPELRDSSIREIFVRRYRLLYHVGADDVLVLAFVHGGRDLTRRPPDD